MFTLCILLIVVKMEGVCWGVWLKMHVKHIYAHVKSGVSVCASMGRCVGPLVGPCGDSQEEEPYVQLCALC